jgi:hypothetical protein
MTESVKKTAMLMEELPDADEGEIIARLMATSIAESVAHELVTFVPMAFGRFAFRDSGVTFSRLFALHRNGRIVARQPLSGEPVYNSAWAVAREFFENSDGHTYLAIAGRSAEVRAINGLFEKGSRAENIVLSDPLVSLPLRETCQRASIWRTVKWLFGVEQSHAPEPAAGPDSNGQASPPAR